MGFNEWRRERGMLLGWLELYGYYRVSGAVTGNIYEKFPDNSLPSYVGMAADIVRNLYEFSLVLPAEMLWYGTKGFIHGVATASLHPFSANAWKQLGHTLLSVHTMHNYDHGDLIGTKFAGALHSVGIDGSASEIWNVGAGIAALYVGYAIRQHRRRRAVNIEKESLELLVHDANTY